MRKILSVIMVVAMLVTSVLPAITSVAAADADAVTFEVATEGFILNEDGTGSADIDIMVTNNPGYTDIKYFVYYKNADIAINDYVAVDELADFSNNNGFTKRSNNSAYKNYFTAVGVTPAATLYLADLYHECYDVDTGDAVRNTYTGKVGTLSITSKADFSDDMAVEMGVIVCEAYDENGDEVAVDPAHFTFTVGAKAEDPYATVYADEKFDSDKFVVNVPGTTVFANGFEEGVAPTVDVPVEFKGCTEENIGTTGIWGYTMYLTYPAELSAIAYKNGDIFANGDVSSFDACAKDVDVTEELAKIDDGDPATDAAPIVYEALRAFEYVNYTTYATDGIKIAALQLNPASAATEYLTDGIAQIVTLQLPEDAAAGDRWEIGVCAPFNAFCDSGENSGGNPQVIEGVVFDGGYIDVIYVEEQSYESLTFYADKITVPAGSKYATVNVYMAGNDTPYGVWAALVYFAYSSELSCKVANGKIVPAENPLIIGFEDGDLAALLADPSSANNTVVQNAAAAFAENGFDWENEDFLFSSIYYQDADTFGGLTKSGVIATLTFEIPANAKVGDVYDITLANVADEQVLGYLDDPQVYPCESLDFTLVNGSITIAGEDVVEPEPPVEEHEHDLIHIDAVEAGCHYNGNVEYWYCADEECGLVWTDENLTQVSNHKSVILPATGSDLLVHMDAVEPGCHYNGNVEYWVCYECEQVWADEALTQLTNIKNVILPATGSDNLEHYEAVEPKPGVNGNVEYWYCPDCETIWVDAALTQISNRKNVIIPAIELATVSVSSETVLKGDSVTVDVEIINNPGLFISKYIITYDASVLELDEVAFGEVFAEADCIFNTNVPGTIIIYFENSEIANNTANGVIASITFNTDEECASGDYAIEIVAEEGNNINVFGDDVATDVVNGNVAIIDCPHETVTATVAKAATVYEEGILEYVCNVCGEVVYTEAIAKLAGIEIAEWQSMTAGTQQAFAVTLLNNPGVWCFSVTVAYDEFCLALDRIDSGLFTADEYSYSVANGVVKIYVEANSVADITDDGAAFMLVFDAVSCGYSDLDVELVADNTINAAGENVAFECVDGSVIISCALTYVEAVEVSCHQNGCAEYWHCEYCDAVYSDAQGRFLTNRRNLAIPMTAELVYVEAVEASCHQKGSAAYYYCTECDAVFDEDLVLTNRKNLTIPATAEIVYVEAVEPSCCQTGNSEYWYCSECDAVFADAALTQLTNRKNLTIPATAEIVYVEAVEPSCCQTGSAAYYYCSECDAVFDEDFILTNRKNLTIPATAEIVYVEAVEAACHQNGSAAYYYCSECDAVFDEDFILTNRKNLTIPATAEIIHVDATEAVCHQTGNVEYWYCSECDAVFTDAALTQLSNFKSVIIPAINELTYVAAVEATCHQDGSAEYWYCAECDAVFADAAGRQLTNRKNLTIPATAEIIYVEAVEASCHQTGNVEYWYCSECNAVFTDAALTKLSNFKSVIIPALNELTYVAAVEATCHQDGSAEYWYCAECDAVFADAAGRQLTNRKNLTIPATAEIIHVEAVEAVCHQTGNVEYWYCSECNAVFTDAALTKLSNFKSVIIPALNELTYVAAVEASCHQNGSAEYWYCAECDAVFADAAGKQLTNRKNLTIPATAEIIYVEAVEPSCCQTGNSEYWYCAECDAVFADAALTQLTNRKNLTIPATAEIVYVEAVEVSCHQNGSAAYYYCTECDAVFDEDFILTNRKNLTIPATAEIIHVDAVEAVCHQTGNVEYWYCSECDAVFTDAALTKLSNFKSVITPAPVELTYVAAAAATCTEDGNVEYWYCAECDAVFADAMGAIITNRKNVVVPAEGHIAGDKVVTKQPTADEDGAWEIRCSVCGELLDSGVIAKSDFIVKVSGTDYVKSVALDGETIVLDAKANGLYAKIAIAYANGVKVESDAIVSRGPGYAYLIVNYGEAVEIIATDANGNTKTYTVDATWNFEYIGGYTVEKVEFDGNSTFNVFAKPGMNNASIGIKLAANVTYELPAGIEAVKNGGYVYFKALEKAANDTYEIVLNNGVVITINYVFDFQDIAGLQPGYMLDSYELAAGNVVNLVCDAKYSYASFKFALNNTTSTIAWDEEAVDVVMDGANHWFKVYNDGTNAVTTEMVVTNAATGVSDTYTVNVTFASNN